MDCRELEDRLEALLDGALGAPERQRCLRHLEDCRECRELAEPLALAVAPPADLLDAVLARTSGPACDRAESLLGPWQEDELGGADRQLLAAHLDGCPGCRSLAAVMARLRAELPELAELRPDPGFVEAVLRATLPARVRLRRWWAAAWPRWVRRPRFASEAAFVGTLALVMLFATPGTPLAAVPNRALELARSDPAAALEAGIEAPMAALGERFSGRVKRPISGSYTRGAAAVRACSAAAAETGQRLTGEVASWLGTTRDRLASLLASADEQASASQDDTANPTQETP